MRMALLFGCIALGFAAVACDSAETSETTEISEVQGTEVEASVVEETGELSFAANGEDFVRSGFVSVDGWHITFNHVYVTLSNISAFQTDPPYDPHSGEVITSDVIAGMVGTYTVDLAEGDENAEPITVGTISGVTTGHYNALSWNLVPATDGPSAGYSIYIDAQASKDDQSYEVFLGFEERYSYYAGEYVGDCRKGFVTAEEPGDLEMTFHFDHIFGDFDQPADSDLNLMAIGFEPFAELMQEGTVSEDLTSLFDSFDEETTNKLLDVLPTLGHTGEGHCHCTLMH